MSRFLFFIKLCPRMYWVCQIPAWPSYSSGFYIFWCSLDTSDRDVFWEQEMVIPPPLPSGGWCWFQELLFSRFSSQLSTVPLVYPFYMLLKTPLVSSSGHSTQLFPLVLALFLEAGVYVQVYCIFEEVWALVPGPVCAWLGMPVMRAFQHPSPCSQSETRMQQCSQQWVILQYVIAICQAWVSCSKCDLCI